MKHGYIDKNACDWCRCSFKYYVHHNHETAETFCSAMCYQRAENFRAKQLDLPLQTYQPPLIQDECECAKCTHTHHPPST